MPQHQHCHSVVQSIIIRVISCPLTSLMGYYTRPSMSCASNIRNCSLKRKYLKLIHVGNTRARPPYEYHDHVANKFVERPIHNFTGVRRKASSGVLVLCAAPALFGISASSLSHHSPHVAARHLRFHSLASSVHNGRCNLATRMKMSKYRHTPCKTTHGFAKLHLYV
jgi:hypothetical protein